MKQLQIKNFV